MIDFAVNLLADVPPGFMLDGLRTRMGTWAAYPNAEAVREEIAHSWSVTPEMVLPTSGAAEAFSLIAHAFSPKLAVMVHPQFTEPEAALRRHQRSVSRAILEGDFRLRCDSVAAQADLVLVGNPTNPTGVLHPRTELLALGKPGRILVVDEAFLDLAGDEHSLISRDMSGILVIRSLTKVFSIAGIRAGYVIGDPRLIDLLREKQPPWSVSAPACDVLRLSCTDQAAQHVASAAADLTERRADLVARLVGLGLHVVDSSAPFVLVETSAIDRHKSLRADLAQAGIAVRRGETFPGLGPTWLRVAVRDAKRHALLEQAIGELVR